MIKITKNNQNYPKKIKLTKIIKKRQNEVLDQKCSFGNTVSLMRKSENVKKNHLEESLLFHDQGGIEEQSVWMIFRLCDAGRDIWQRLFLLGQFTRLNVAIK